MKSNQNEKAEIQKDILDILSEKNLTTKHLRKEEAMQRWEHKWDEVKMTLYSLTNMGILRNVSLFTQTSGTVYGLTEHGRKYHELIQGD